MAKCVVDLRRRDGGRGRGAGEEDSDRGRDVTVAKRDGPRRCPPPPPEAKPQPHDQGPNFI